MAAKLLDLSDDLLLCILLWCFPTLRLARVNARLRLGLK